MKRLLFIITLFSIGRLIETQGEDDADSNLSGTEVSNEVTEDNSPEKSEQITADDNNDSIGDEENASENESSEDESSEQKETRLLGSPNSKENDTKRQKIYQDAMNRFLSEVKMGDDADLIGQNQHMEQSHQYIDLGRRSIAQDLKNIAAENADYLTPEKAPPELVLLVAKESALLRAGKDKDLESDFDRKKILRTGDYWNGVWKEEVKPKSVMRSASQKKKLGSIKAKINQGTELYKVVSRMKKISPQLLYIINKRQS